MHSSRSRAPLHSIQTHERLYEQARLDFEGGRVTECIANAGAELPNPKVMASRPDRSILCSAVPMRERATLRRAGCTVSVSNPSRRG